ncbi:hypothetical protein E2C01_075604 [Portunus trituberculatus]|uniref:Uncharacterized protein n=1 Tax=Portunus trituberculatus TaxID=210409 RepID=A0A5B7IKN6_PORTR|nr:hypothetical protein [Portunus trituberculatus]
MHSTLHSSTPPPPSPPFPNTPLHQIHFTASLRQPLPCHLHCPIITTPHFTGSWKGEVLRQQPTPPCHYPSFTMPPPTQRSASLPPRH